jgi:hypothetical protein
MQMEYVTLGCVSEWVGVLCLHDWIHGSRVEGSTLEAALSVLAEELTTAIAF